MAVFNSLNWPRSGAVEIDLQDGSKGIISFFETSKPATKKEMLDAAPSLLAKIKEGILVDFAKEGIAFLAKHAGMTIIIALANIGVAVHISEGPGSEKTQHTQLTTVVATIACPRDQTLVYQTHILESKTAGELSKTITQWCVPVQKPHN